MMNKNAELNATTAGTAGQPKQPATGTKKKHTYPSAADLARGDRIRALRNRMNSTPQEVATEVGVDKTTINRWENGVSIPREESLTALAQYFGVDENYLRYGKKENNDDIIDLSGLTLEDKKIVRNLVSRLQSIHCA